MKVSYQHANPKGGQESYYIKFTDDVEDQTMCILVDSGAGVSVRDDLDEGEHLGAILLTHPHGDHYASLANNIVDGADVYTSPDTERVLETILEETSKHDDIGNPQTATEALTSITDWTTVWNGVEVYPVPAGHCPGAVGFVLRFESSGEQHYILASGDFTFHPVAGNPGMPERFPFEIDALFMNASVSRNRPFTDSIEEIVSTVLEQTVAGGRTVVTASGLAGVHIGYLLGHLGEESGRDMNVVIAGHLAKLYDDLGYEVPGVETVPNFSDPSHLVSDGRVCIAGPSVPKNNAAGRIFDQIRDDPSASLIQVLGGNTHDPVETAKCTVYSFEYSAHPVQDELDEFVEQVLPRQLIIEHGRTHAYGDRYDFTITWSNRDLDEYTLYENGYWCSPEWITDDANKSIRANHTRRINERVKSTAQGGRDLPAISRNTSPQLREEGISESILEPPVQSHSSEVESGDDEEEDTTSERDEQVRDADTGGDGLQDVDADVLESIDQRLSHIEDSIQGETIDATVVDLHDGEIALKIEDEDIADLLTHGATVRLTLHTDDS